MEAFNCPPNLATQGEDSIVITPPEPRWDLAFLGITFYLIVEYTRLPIMFPALQPLHVSKIAAGISGVGLLLARRGQGKSSPIRRIDAALLLFLLAGLLSACFADYQQPAWNTFFDALRWGIVYFLVSRIVSGSWRLRTFVFLLLILNLKLAQFAIRSYFLGGGITPSGDQLAMVTLANAKGWFGNSNDFGVAMCVVWPLTGALFIGETKKLARALMLACFVGIFVALLLSGCRGALLGACAAALVAAVRTGKKLLAFSMGLLIILGVLLFLPQANLQRLRSMADWQKDPEASHRIGLWKAGLRMFRDHPVLGVGPGNFSSHYRNYFPDSDPDPQAWAPHSIYFQGLSEFGIVGIIPLLALWTLSLRLNGHTRRLIRDWGLGQNQGFEFRLALGLELALVAYFVSGAFLTVLFYPHLWFLLGLSVGLHKACVRKQLEVRTANLQESDQRLALALQ